MKLKLAFLWVLIKLSLVVGGSVPGEIYSSLVHVHRLFQFDHVVGQALLQLSAAGAPETQRYKEMYMWTIEDANFSSNADQAKAIEDLTGNPLHVYALMKRVLYFWYIVHHDLVQHGLSSEVANMLEETILPSEKDFTGTALALARLQQVYNLEIKDLANGTILHRQSSVRLTIFDCIRIANASYWERSFINSWQWYLYSLYATEDIDFRMHIWLLMKKVAFAHDQQLHPNRNDESYMLPLSQSPMQVPPSRHYFYLCRGQQFSGKGQAFDRLKCHISDRGSPYLRLQPIKYEELHFAPELYFFHDVMSNKQIQLIKKLASDNLARATFHAEAKNSESRVTHTAWLKNISHPSLESLAKRISYMTGLHVHEGRVGNSAGEELQVQCYGVGGHYLLHYDPLYKSLPERKWTKKYVAPATLADGDRLASLMIYMSNVEAGGRTIFSAAGISITPVEGGAAFWYNIDRQGRLDHFSIHAGCPVLLGHKWAANKWIRENANFLKRPCDASKNIVGNEERDT